MVVHKAPHECARRILLCVSGMTPQIVTETLQALLDQSPRFEPTAIRIVTTAQGKAKAEKQLIAEGHLAALCADYGLDAPPLDFTPIRDADGKELDDIRNGTDNTAAADCILAIVRELTQDAGCAIHASLAGGRKTMSHYMGYALSLFGRPQDRLSHVLVAPDWAERAVDFHYRPQQPVELLDQTKKRLGDSNEVMVTLADIPLLRFRDWFPPSLIRSPLSFSATVERANRALDTPELILDPERRRMLASGYPVKLQPIQFAFLLWFACRRHERRPGIVRISIDSSELNELLMHYRSLYKHADVFTRERIEKDKSVRKLLALADNPQRKPRTKYFDEICSKLGKTLECQIGVDLAGRYLPVADDGTPDRYAHTDDLEEKTYRLRLDPDCIHFRTIPD